MRLRRITSYWIENVTFNKAYCVYCFYYNWRHSIDRADKKKSWDITTTFYQIFFLLHFLIWIIDHNNTWIDNSIMIPCNRFHWKNQKKFSTVNSLRWMSNKISKSTPFKACSRFPNFVNVAKKKTVNKGLNSQLERPAKSQYICGFLFGNISVFMFKTNIFAF